MPMLNAENADIDELKNIIKNALKQTPVKENDIEMLCEMIINHCSSLCND